MTDTTDILAKWEFEIDCADVEVERGTAGNTAECIRDLAAEVRSLRSGLAKAKEMWDAEMLMEDALNEEVHRLMLRVTDLETKCDRCGLKMAHDPTPGITVTQSEVTFTPGEVVYIPAR